LARTRDRARRVGLVEKRSRPLERSEQILGQAEQVTGGAAHALTVILL
jgi:hypothetical protein